MPQVLAGPLGGMPQVSFGPREDAPEGVGGVLRGVFAGVQRGFAGIERGFPVMQEVNKCSRQAGLPQELAPRWCRRRRVAAAAAAQPRPLFLSNQMNTVL